MEVADEIAQHLEDRYAEFLTQGMTDEQAADRTNAEIESGELLAELTDVFPND
jgi:hypothetical protein